MALDGFVLDIMVWAEHTAIYVTYLLT